ncbi:VID27-like protein [Drosophila nasuta]|uniref:VID27-like protein n=1 Tax=Drosophila nasuta TaxID=42062 RepID=UPI00295EDF4A|nr:VID27-like protein [Drosophila nasuta]
MDNKLLGANSVEDKIMELDADKVCLVTDTFSKADLFLQSNEKFGYIKLNAPGLYNFRLPQSECECVHDVSTVNVEQMEEDELTDKWMKEPMDEINLIEAEEEQQLGLLQRDEATGELYMLLPLEVDVLLQPEQQLLQELPAEEEEQAEEEEEEARQNDEDEDEDEADHEDLSQTTLTDTPKLPPEQLHKVCHFVVPKMSLNFQLTLQIGNLATEADED